MQKFKSIFFPILILNFLASCDSSNTELAEPDVPKKEQIEAELPDQQFEISIFEETYPFPEAERIEIISYPIRMIWDTTNVDGDTQVNEGIIKNGKIRLPKSRIIDHVKLSETQSKELFEVLYNTDCTESLEMSCWDPRHSFVFFDHHNKAFAAIEICFDCLGSMESEGIAPIHWCFEKESAVTKYLKEVGITYFGGAPEEDDY